MYLAEKECVSSRKSGERLSPSPGSGLTLIDTYGVGSSDMFLDLDHGTL